MYNNKYINPNENIAKNTNQTTKTTSQEKEANLYTERVCKIPKISLQLFIKFPIQYIKIYNITIQYINININHRPTNINQITKTKRWPRITIISSKSVKSLGLHPSAQEPESTLKQLKLDKSLF